MRPPAVQVGMMDPAARRGMMAADELEDLERLEQLGSLHDKLEEDWKQDQREQACRASRLSFEDP